MIKRIIKDLEELRETLLFYGGEIGDVEIVKIDDMLKYLLREDKLKKLLSDGEDTI